MSGSLPTPTLCRGIRGSVGSSVRRCGLPPVSGQGSIQPAVSGPVDDHTMVQPRRLLWLPVAVQEALARQLRLRAIDCGHSGHVSALNSCMHISMRKRESNREVSWPEKRQGSRGAVWHRGRLMIGMSSGGRLRSSRRSFRPLSCIVGGHDSP